MNAADDAAGTDDGSAPDGRAIRAQRRREQRREAILEVAKTVFHTKGYHQASVHDIIEAAQIARGTFYLYFTSKRDVLQELLDEFLRLIREAVHPISLEAGAPAPLTQLEANLHRVLDVVVAHEELATIALRDPTSFDAESWEPVNEFFTHVLQMTESALRVGQGLGLIRECNVHVAAATAVGGVREALTRMLAARRKMSTHPGGDRAQSLADADQVAHNLIGFILNGVLK